jgi:endonuclease-3
MKKSDIHEVYAILNEIYEGMDEPSVTQISNETARDPFRVLISCLISLRTKDEVTLEASKRLFEKAYTPEMMIKLSKEEIQKLIYPCAFYKNKSESILNISEKLITEYNSVVPDEIEELLKFKGVGRKTANLVLAEGYNKPAICVDTHVHRIFNRLGYIKTPKPDKTEMALRKKLPEEYWIRINEILVAYGREVCKPISPFCSACRLINYCDKVNVERWR